MKILSLLLTYSLLVILILLFLKGVSDSSPDNIRKRMKENKGGEK